MLHRHHHLRNGTPTEMTTSPEVFGKGGAVIRPLLKITVPPKFGERQVVRLDGELDMATAPQVAAVLETMLASKDHREIVVDLTDLNFIDANGLRVLIVAQRVAATHGRVLRACDPRYEVDLILRLTGVAELLGLPSVPLETTDSTSYYGT